MKAEQLVHEWRSTGKMVRVLGREVFTVDTGASDLPVLVFLHGYPSSSFDYCHVLPLLRNDFRIIVHDHLGFGLSEKPSDYSYSLLDQADVALSLWSGLKLKSVHLVAHDYGTSVATEILARRLTEDIGIDIRSVTLSNGSIHIEMAKLRLIQKLLRHRFWGPVMARLGSEAIYVHQMRRLWYDKEKCEAEELRALWRMGSEGNGRRVLPKVTQYLRERYTYWHRWIGALEQLDIPAHILWAQDDPVAVAAIGEQLYREIPGAVITRLEKLGHYPMLEDPLRWTGALKIFLEPLADMRNGPAHV